MGVDEGRLDSISVDRGQWGVNLGRSGSILVDLGRSGSIEVKAVQLGAIGFNRGRWASIRVD